MSEQQQEHDTANVLITIDITDQGRITCWTVSRGDGQVLEDWRLRGQFLDAAHSYTWQVPSPTYLVVRDMLRYLTEADWEPDTVM